MKTLAQVSLVGKCPNTHTVEDDPPLNSVVAVPL